MNFYIGNSIDKVTLSDDNTLFEEDLQRYIYKIKDNNHINMEKLYSIDPYSDVEISVQDIPEIVGICKYILKNSLLDKYEEVDEAIESINDLIYRAETAFKMGVGLVSIGD